MATRTRSPGMSGLALTMAALGGYAVYAGLNGVPFTEGLRSIVSGKLPAPRPPTVTQVNWTPVAGAAVDLAQRGVDAATAAAGPNAFIATAARKYLGIPYRFGGHDPRTGLDCSGFVTVVLKDVGITNLPNLTHTVTGEFYVWSGAATIPRSECRAGDLVCWIGHIGIATSATTMIAAPTTGDVVKEQKIWWTPQPLIRRVKNTRAGHP